MKFVDDLTILEIVNLLTIGISSFNIKQSIPSDIKESNQYIPPENLKSSEYLEQIDIWSRNQKMKINEKKSTNVIFNFTKKYQFSTRLSIKNEVLEIVPEANFLAIIISNDLKWSKNTENIVKKANGRMELLQKNYTLWCKLGRIKKYIHSVYKELAGAVLYSLE